MGCFCSKDSNASSAAAARSRVDNDLGLVSGAGRYSEQETYAGEFGGLPRRDRNDGNDKRAPRPVRIKPAPKRASVSQVKWKNPIDVRHEYAVPEPIPNGNDRPPRPVRIRPRPQRSTLWSVGWRSVKGDKKAAQKRGSVNDDE
ncbi:hypothetical protein CDV36_008347 [Fusarium kuroshium]|uniref:Uncharacterized protein n=1 Tax=Fusarium kuroshium TaxID=2010991 RepID=A0A3M2S368_9HYPO|nr:hypothetical protein CDV36_008347 [Fusarium kuroshium]